MGNKKLASATIFLCLILQACTEAGFVGSGLTAGEIDIDGPNADYVDLANSEGSLETVVLSGVAVTSDNEITRLTGAIDHETGAISIAFPDGTFTDPDGVDSSGFISNGVTEFRVSPRTEFAFSPFSEDVYTIIGVPTDPTDMPSAGSATYAGVLFFGDYDGTSESYRASSLAELVADFSDQTVEIAGDEIFQTLNTEGRAEFDSVVITGLTISGNEFSGSPQVVMTSRGVEVTPIGPLSDTGVVGSFFGYDTDTSAPETAGAVGFLQGDTGRLRLIFGAQ